MKLLKKEEFLFTKDNVRQNVLIPFPVEEAFNALLIQMSYAPHKVEEPERCKAEIRKCLQRYLPSEYQPVGEINPKDYGTLFNFVTLSLDCGDRYIGCAHRHDPDMRLWISAEQASPGFDPVPVTKGLWRVVLHVHAVISDSLPCRLQIWGIEEGES